MKWCYMLIFVALITGCISHIHDDEVDKVAALKAMQTLQLLCNKSADSFRQEVEYPDPIGKKYSFCHADGAYIRLNSFFVEESGLYMPKSGKVLDAKEGSDPSYKAIGEGLYSYVIRG